MKVESSGGEEEREECGTGEKVVLSLGRSQGVWLWCYGFGRVVW